MIHLQFRIMALRFLVLCPLVLPPPPLHAGTNGILEGTVKARKTNEALPGVNVVLVETQSGAATDLNGQFEIQNIRAGGYTVRFTHVGYQTRILKNVVINPDLRTRVIVELEQTDVELEEIVVIQEKPLIQKDVTGTTYIVAGEEIKSLPLDNVIDFVGLKAGVTLEGNVRGGKRTEVSYLVDGLPVQDAMTGGVSTFLPTSSVVGMSIYTGGFEPEYGNALSGVVNIVTRSASNEHRFYARADKDNLFGGTQVSRTTTFEVSGSGPIAGSGFAYVAALNGGVSDTRWWQDFQHFFGSPIDKNVNGFGKLDYSVSPTFRVGAQLLYSYRGWHDYEFSWRYNLGGVPPEQRNSYRLAAIVSHSVGDNFFYTASLSAYVVGTSIGEGGKQDVPVNDPYQYDFFLRYIVGGQRSLWSRADQVTYTGKFDGTLRGGRVHLVKFGAELSLFDLNSDIVKYEPRKTYFGKPLVNDPQLDFSSSYIYRPRTGSLYIQDKIDLLDEGILLNLGIRYDFLDPRAQRPFIEATLLGDTAYAFSAKGSTQASFKQQFSPRFGAAMQVAERGYLFINLGWYFQYPLFDYLYTGLDRVALAKGVSALTGNPDLEPERSKSWEISLKYSFPQNLVGSITYFRKETSNLVDSKTFIPGDSKLAGNFGFAEFVNNPYAECSGFELVLTRDRGAWLTGEVSYTYMVAEGTSGRASDGFYIAQYGLPPSSRLYPLSWDQTYTWKGVVNVSTPVGLNLNFVAQWHSGRPYTNYPTSTGFETIDGGRFYQNNARMPAYFNLDLKAEQHFKFHWWREASLTFFVDCRNLTNQQNVSWLDSNGRIGGELDDPSGYFIGRRTSLGVRAEF